MANDVETVIGALRKRASSFISSGCQSGAYFISNRVIFRSAGDPSVPVDVMIHPELPRDSVTCWRPIGFPENATVNSASPVAGSGTAGACVDGVAAVRRTAASAVQ